jgi:hypothetical protein
VQELLDQGHGLLECARRLGWTLNTAKRYAHAAAAEELKRPPRYRETPVNPYRDHLRRRRTEEPGVAVTRPLAEIRELGYTGNANLLVRYLNQGRADAIRTPPSPRRPVSWLTTRPTDLPAHHRQHPDDLLATCAHLTVLAEPVRQLADLLTGRRGEGLDTWMTSTDADDLPALHDFVHGQRRDLPAVVTGLTLPYSNGPIEGAKVKFLKRQMYGRTGFDLLRQRILLTGLLQPGRRRAGTSVSRPAAGPPPGRGSWQLTMEVAWRRVRRFRRASSAWVCSKSSTLVPSGN